ncbi:hypothetical protein AB205_0117890, partial [Aquarana catesbeiana]
STNVAFKETLNKIQMSPECGGLPMISFLILPMQRATRLPLLMDTICQKTDMDSPEYEANTRALKAISKSVRRKEVDQWLLVWRDIGPEEEEPHMCPPVPPASATNQCPPISANRMSDRARWITALEVKEENRRYSKSKSAALRQVEIIKAYMAKQPDEVSLQQADVVLVLQEEDGNTDPVSSFINCASSKYYLLAVMLIQWLH